MSTNMEALLEARRQLEEQRRRLEEEGREGELRLRELQQRQEQALARLARAGVRRDARVEEAAAARARVAAAHRQDQGDLVGLALSAFG